MCPAQRTCIKHRTCIKQRTCIKHTYIHVSQVQLRAMRVPPAPTSHTRLVQPCGSAPHGAGTSSATKERMTRGYHTGLEHRRMCDTSLQPHASDACACVLPLALKHDSSQRTAAALCAACSMLHACGTAQHALLVVMCAVGAWGHRGTDAARGLVGDCFGAAVRHCHVHFDLFARRREARVDTHVNVPSTKPSHARGRTRHAHEATVCEGKMR